MLGKYLVAGFLLLFAGVSAAAGGQSSTSYEGVAETVQNAVSTYLALEPRLTEDQKEQFKEAYAQLCKSYQTSGILLESAIDTEDPGSAHTAIVAYKRTVVQLPAMADKVSRLVQGFKGGK
jgi:hypothetical protein